MYELSEVFDEEAGVTGNMVWGNTSSSSRLHFSSGEGASCGVDDFCRGVASAGRVSASEHFSGSPARCVGRPKSSILAGLPEPISILLNLGDVTLFLSDVEELSNVRSEEKMSWAVRFRRFAGLMKVPPGDSGRLLVRICLLSGTAGRYWCNGNSCKGKRRMTKFKKRSRKVGVYRRRIAFRTRVQQNNAVAACNVTNASRHASCHDSKIH